MAEPEVIGADGRSSSAVKSAESSGGEDIVAPLELYYGPHAQRIQELEESLASLLSGSDTWQIFPEVPINPQSQDHSS